MKKSDWEDIDVNERSTDKVFFESSLLQNISDSIDFLKEEATGILLISFYHLIPVMNLIWKSSVKVP